MESCSRQGNVTSAIIRTMAVNCTLILDCSKNDRKSEVETTSDEMVLGAAWVLCEFSLLAGKQNHPNLFLTAPDNALKGYNKEKGHQQQP
jgi:hypothetical protein